MTIMKGLYAAPKGAPRQIISEIDFLAACKVRS
jgi:hypothetical protein